jgi:hypothetical protein
VADEGQLRGGKKAGDVRLDDGVVQVADDAELRLRTRSDDLVAGGDFLAAKLAARFRRER